MKKQYFFLSLLLPIATLASCGSDNDEPDVTTVTVSASPTSLTATADGGTFTIDVTTTGKEWTAYTDQDWIKIEESGTVSQKGTVKVTVAANTVTTARNGEVTVKSGTARTTVSVSQAAAEKPAETPISTPEGYKLVWHDEFDSGTAPNTSDWYYETGHGSNGWGNNEIQNYVDGTTHPDICKIQDGILNIWCRQVGSEVQSIRVNTTKAWTYGYFEARLKLPSGKGTWPAFWMMPKNFTSWPGDGEIDIMEEVGYNPNYVLATIHCNKYNNGGTKIESNGMSIPTAQTEFHVYACEWTADYLKFIFDGKEVLTYRNDGTGKNAWPFNAPFYLKLNLAWGGNWGGAQGVDNTALPANYQIDYVRVFQKE